MCPVRFVTYVSGRSRVFSGDSCASRITAEQLCKRSVESVTLRSYTLFCSTKHFHADF